MLQVCTNASECFLLLKQVLTYIGYPKVHSLKVNRSARHLAQARTYVTSAFHKHALCIPPREKLYNLFLAGNKTPIVCAFCFPSTPRKTHQMIIRQCSLLFEGRRTKQSPIKLEEGKVKKNLSLKNGCMEAFLYL
ncbi:hypothetical protein NPIL_676711 [Nephila pilipes]|uniref:Uncharacterized protein n=1 Tax=Nephila pilipes TaxID=299642 RepID=A0A8X6T4S1_NEPPI|nr:hypothetical protein NPIL_676711 [Nephila pilipes]